MDKVMSLNYCLGLLGLLLLLQGVFIVEGRSILSPGNQVLSKEDPDAWSKPVERNDPLGLELANRFIELEELEALREDLQLEKEITANDFSEGKAMPRKRGGEPCFWKYCL